jgi:hypothetical protein
MNRLRSNAASPGLWLLSLLYAAVGCADARGRFESFESRVRSSADSAGAGSDGTQGIVDESYDGSPCLPPAPNTVTGPALLAFDTNGNAGLPILFLGTIDTPELAGTTAVHFVYRALDSLDRSTRVGEELEVGPYPLEDGVLMARVPETTLDGAANPVLHGVPLTSSLTLYGHICGLRRFYCGTLDGQLSGVLSGPVTGHFGITLLAGPDSVPDRPRFGCGATDFAEPLAR